MISLLQIFPAAENEQQHDPPAKSSSSTTISRSRTRTMVGLRIFIAVTSLVGIPLAFYEFHVFPGKTLVGSVLRQTQNVWDAFLRLDMVHMAALTMLISLYFGGQCCSGGSCHTSQSTRKQNLQEHLEEPLLKHQKPQDESETANNPSCPLGTDRHCTKWGRRLSKASGGYVYQSKAQSCLKRLRATIMTVDGLGICLTLVLGIFTANTKALALFVPSWIFYPFALFDYKMYPPSQLESALQGICLDQYERNHHQVLVASQTERTSLGLPDIQQQHQEPPLCLNEDSWKFLSTGELSSYNSNDVETVLRGVDYARNKSGGLAIAVLARDIQNKLPSFRQNVQALSHFFPNKLAVVIFENDSSDGSRQAIQEWAAEVLKESSKNGYVVDLLHCEDDEAPNCQFGKVHRDWDTGDFGLSKAIGDMHSFRQRVSDHITQKMPAYDHYSHMLVTDIDLGVSMGPLGVIHTLGQYPDKAVASSGRFLLPDGFGKLRTPYDYSAFVPQKTDLNGSLLKFHEIWCSLMPPGTRWRNMCDAPSPMMLSEMLRLDRGQDGDFYEVDSAFNGAVLYPIPLIKQSHAMYDAGDDGQRCEHVGFNLSLGRNQDAKEDDHQSSSSSMLVNRRWNMHLDPTNPGGPTGWRAHNVANYIATTPQLIIPMTCLHFTFFFFFFHSCVTLGVLVVYPLVSTLYANARTNTMIFRLLLTSRSPKQKRLIFSFLDLNNNSYNNNNSSSSSSSCNAKKNETEKTGPIDNKEDDALYKVV